MLAKRQRPAAQAAILATRSLQGKRRSWSDVVPFDLVVDALEHGEHGIVFGEDAANREGRVDVERFEFAHPEQSENVIDVGVDENCSADWGMSGRSLVGLRVQVGSRFDLPTQVGRGSQ